MRRSNAQRAGGWCKPAVTDTRKSSRRSGAELSGAIRTQYGLAVSDDGCPTLLGTRMLVRCRVPVYSNIAGIRVVTRYIKSVPSDRDGFFICCGCMGAGLLRIASHKLRERKTTWGVEKLNCPTTSASAEAKPGYAVAWHIVVTSAQAGGGTPVHTGHRGVAER